jgi:hypothetical protein
LDTIIFLWKPLNINFHCNWSIGTLRNLLCVLATILKIAAKMDTIMAAKAAILKLYCHYHIPRVENLLNINFRWNCSTLKIWFVLADILKMAAILTICAQFRT